MTRKFRSFIMLLCCLPLAGAFAQSQSVVITQTPQKVVRPRKCGITEFRKAQIARDPTWAQKFQDQKASLQAAADYYRQYKAQVASGERTTDATISPVPVVFHIIVDSAQFNALGGTSGIIQRVDSQIEVLNEDYNHMNRDSTMIPSAWKDSLWGNPGISFGLARIDPSGNCSPGYEIKIINGTTLTDAGYDPISELYSGSGLLDEKEAGTGLAAWDVTKYYNVWCINYIGQSTDLLGLTEPLSEVSGAQVTQEGVDILYNTLGSVGPTNVPPPGTGNWYLTPDNYAWGRTLTHETGHFFEIWHPWGDDGPEGSHYYSGDGYCPWKGLNACSTADTVIGSDDGLYDTPPESQAQYGNPAYTVPGGTINDCCQYWVRNDSANTQPIGIACLSFMDYTDDDAMHLFTPDQAASMASMVLVPSGSGSGPKGQGTPGENYNLTQNPNLLIPCGSTGIAPSPTELNSSLSIYPNPTTGEVNISVNSAAETLNRIIVINLLGQQVITVPGQGKDYYTLDLSGVSKGIYFVQCNFASGSVTRKIVLQ